jgi:hypothetical protein
VAFARTVNIKTKQNNPVAKIAIGVIFYPIIPKTLHLSLLHDTTTKTIVFCALLVCFPMWGSNFVSCVPVVGTNRLLTRRRNTTNV